MSDIEKTVKKVQINGRSYILANQLMNFVKKDRHYETTRTKLKKFTRKIVLNGNKQRIIVKNDEFFEILTKHVISRANAVIRKQVPRKYKYAHVDDVEDVPTKRVSKKLFPDFISYK